VTDRMTDRHIEGLKQQQAALHHVSENLANERTILAEVAVTIAVMTLGIAGAGSEILAVIWLLGLFVLRFGW